MDKEQLLELMKEHSPYILWEIQTMSHCVGCEIRLDTFEDYEEHLAEALAKELK